VHLRGACAGDGLADGIGDLAEDAPAAFARRGASAVRALDEDRIDDDLVAGLHGVGDVVRVLGVVLVDRLDDDRSRGRQTISLPPEGGVAPSARPRITIRASRFGAASKNTSAPSRRKGPMCCRCFEGG
jgi:hypothetical protein